MDKHPGNEEGGHWTTTCCELPSSTDGIRISFDVAARTRPSGPLNFFDRNPIFVHGSFICDRGICCKGGVESKDKCV